MICESNCINCSLICSSPSLPYEIKILSPSSADMDDLVRIDVLEIIRSYLPAIHEKIDQE